MKFVMDTYNGLYKLESRMLSGKSSICVFCRLDIGLIQGGNNSFHYFVNEVERTQTASLWSNLTGISPKRSHIDLFGSTFAHALYMWLHDIDNSCII